MISKHKLNILFKKMKNLSAKTEVYSFSWLPDFDKASYFESNDEYERFVNWLDKNNDRTKGSNGMRFVWVDEAVVKKNFENFRKN